MSVLLKSREEIASSFDIADELRHVVRMLDSMVHRFTMPEYIESRGDEVGLMEEEAYQLDLIGQKLTELADCAHALHKRDKQIEQQSSE